MHIRITQALACIVFAFFLSANASALENGFFGYWANNDHYNDNSDHTNITHVWGGYSDISYATSQLLTQLAQVQSEGLKAIIEVPVFVFNVQNNNGRAECPYTINSSGATHFGNLISTLVNNNYLTPGNPSSSTVAAFYPVDEPELCGLKDASGSAHPALTHAINIIRNNPNTYNFPIAAISSKKYNDSINGLKLYDWVGMANYSISTQSYLNNFTSFQSALLPTQRAILVPQAATGGFMSVYGQFHEPNDIFNYYTTNNKIIGIIPFLWYHYDTSGIISNPYLKTRYTAIGNYIANDGPTPMTGTVICVGGGSLHECNATISNGTPPFNYSWQPNGNPPNQSLAIINLPCGLYHDVTVTVTDSQGQSLYLHTITYCAPGSGPLSAPMEE